MPSDLIRGWIPVGVKKTRQSKKIEPRSASIGTETALVRGRNELRNQAFVGLEGLLGEIGVEAGDLLRLGNEGLIGRAGEFGLRFDSLVQRLHAGKLFNKRLGVFERLLGIVAVSRCDRLNTALQIARGSSDRFEM